MALLSKRRKRSALVATAVLGSAIAATVFAGARPASGSPPTTTRLTPNTASALAFHDGMRKLWEDHVTWTRNVIISFELNEPDASAVLPDLGAALDRLFQNQADIGNAIKPYYGDEAGDQLTGLLHDHIAIAGEVLTALKTEDSDALTDAQARWYANAYDIAVFLNSANPKNWSLDEMDAMMTDHLDNTTAEAIARANEDWAADVAAYDQVHTQALAMADMLSNGIIDQFPSKFH